MMYMRKRTGFSVSVVVASVAKHRSFIAGARKSPIASQNTTSGSEANRRSRVPLPVLLRQPRFLPLSDLRRRELFSVHFLPLSTYSPDYKNNDQT